MSITEPAARLRIRQPESRSSRRDDEPQFRYVEEFVRHQLSKIARRPPRDDRVRAAVRRVHALLGAAPGIGTGLPHLARSTFRWVPRWGAALVLGADPARPAAKRPVRRCRPSSRPRSPPLIAARTGRAEDVFLPGILYNGFLALISAFTIAIRKPLVGFIIGAAIGDPTGWMSDRGLVKMTSKLTAVLAFPTSPGS